MGIACDVQVGGVGLDATNRVVLLESGSCGEDDARNPLYFDIMEGGSVSKF